MPETRTAGIPSLRAHDDWLARMEEAETAAGWAAFCEEHGIYVALNREFASALAASLESLAGGSRVLEIGAGDGSLARALAAYDLNVVATDVAPKGEHVERLGAGEALDHYRPRVVLACFPPLDAGIEGEVMRARAPVHFVYIGPNVYGGVGPETLWRDGGWKLSELPDPNRYLISRLDYLSDFTRATHQRRASVVLLSRVGEGDNGHLRA